jgi:hypothetical protein
VSVTGPLQLIQEFASTLGGSPATDQLGTREEAAAWLRAAGLLPAEAGLSNSEHAALVRLRDSIRDVLDAHTRGREDGDAAARLTKALADGRLVLTVDAASAVQLASAARSSYPNLRIRVRGEQALSRARGLVVRRKQITSPVRHKLRVRAPGARPDRCPAAGGCSFHPAEDRGRSGQEALTSN